MEQNKGSNRRGDMKNKIYLLLAVLILFGAGCGVKEEAAIVIDDIEITKAEFD